MSTTTRRRPAEIRLAATMAVTLVMAAAATALGFFVPRQAQPGGAFTMNLAIIVAVMAAAELAAVDRRIGAHNHTLSLTEVGLVIGLAFAAPVTLIVGRVIAGAIVYGAIKRIPAPKLAYNTGLFALETAAAAAVFHALIGDQVVHEPVAWMVLAVALAVATVVGLGAVRAILAIHGAAQEPRTLIYSLAISGTATVIGVLAVVGLSAHTEAALLVFLLCGFAVAAMRTIETLTRRLAVPD